MPTLESCGSLLFYQRTGSGAPILLVHSTACTGGLWQGLIRELGAGFSFYTPDLAGYGRSSCEQLGERSTLRDEAEFIAPLLWDSEERFHLLGHSFGGAVALAAAVAWPERIKSLILYEPTAFSLLREGSAEDRAAFATITRVPDDMRASIEQGSYERAMGRFVDFWNGEGAWERLPKAARHDLAPLARKVVGDFRMLFEEAWDAGDLARLRCPVTILTGDRSPAPALRVAEILARLMPVAQLITVPGVGHMAPVTDPALIAPPVLERLTGGRVPAPAAPARATPATAPQSTGLMVALKQDEDVETHQQGR